MIGGFRTGLCLSGARKNHLALAPTWPPPEQNLKRKPKKPSTNVYSSGAKIGSKQRSATDLPQLRLQMSPAHSGFIFWPILIHSACLENTPPPQSCCICRLFWAGNGHSWEYRTKQQGICYLSGRGHVWNLGSPAFIDRGPQALKSGIRIQAGRTHSMSYKP